MRYGCKCDSQGHALTHTQTHSHLAPHPPTPTPTHSYTHPQPHSHSHSHLHSHTPASQQPIAARSISFRLDVLRWEFGRRAFHPHPHPSCTPHHLRANQLTVRYSSECDSQGYTLTLTLPYSHTHTHTHLHSHPPTLTYSHTHPQPHPPTPTLTHTHSDTYTPHSLTLTATPTHASQQSIAARSISLRLDVLRWEFGRQVPHPHPCTPSHPHAPPLRHLAHGALRQRK